MLTRRHFALSSVAATLACASAPQSPEVPTAVGAAKMKLSIHQNTSRAAGFRGSLEGWARAGIKYVELADRVLDGFLENDTIAGAKALIDDLGLTPVSAAANTPDIWIPGPEREASLESWRRRCDQFVTLGVERMYSASTTRRPVTAEDFDATPGCIREVAEISKEFGLTAMIEFTRFSTHLSTMRSALEAIRAADHPNVRPMMDFFHFWSGLSKFEDLDLLEPGELAHAHFQDLLDAPQELTDNTYRIIPGDGITPIVKILRKLAEKEYDGALSVELFRQEIVNGDPYDVAAEIKAKCEAVMSEAGVL